MAVFRDLRRPSFLSATRRKLRAAVAPIRSLVESLENRLHLTVTPGPNGFTNVTPSASSRLIYVSSSTGSDGNSGLSPSSPLASINAAYALLRNDEPDWILFKRGDTFSGSFHYFNDSGLSAQEPMVITSYGDTSLPRPVIDSGSASAFVTGQYVHDLFIMGISFTTSTHNPTSPNYNGQGDYGLYDTGNTTDMLVEDCSFSYFISDITFTDYYGPMYRITINACEILDSYSTVGHSQGLYVDNTTNLTVTNNVFDHDGWNASVAGGGATIYNHDCYLHSSNINCVVTGNIFADAGSFGLQARAGGIVDNNLFIGDPYGWSFGLVNGATTAAGGVSGQAVGNVVIEPRVDTANGWGIGAMIGNLNPNAVTTISNNIFATEPGGTQPAMIFEPGTGVSNPQQEVGLNSVTVSNNTVYDWGFGLQVSNQYVPGSTGADGFTGVVFANNNFQDNVTGRIINQGPAVDPRYETWSGNTYSSTTAPQSSWFTVAGVATSFASWLANDEPTASAATANFVSPNRTIETYMAAQGLAATLSAFVAGADAQNEQNWNPLYFAATVNSYIEGGYIVDTTPPTAVAVPPADVTPANDLTNPTPTFTVTFSDAVGINASTITSSSIVVTGAGGTNLPVTLVGTAGSGTSITATYQLAAPGGNWTSVPYGTYVISVVAGQVKDTSGNAMPAQPLASFNVTVNANPNPPAAAATTPASFNAVAGSSNIALSWTDPANDQQSFILQRATDAGITQNVVTLPLTADKTSYTDNTAFVGTTYYYTLTATNAVGPSAPTAAASATILPPAPAFSRMILDDGNASRTAITSATLVFTQPVTLSAANLSLLQNGTTPTALTVKNPTGDGKTFVLTWPTSDGRLPDGSYTLTVHGATISDSHGQTAGGDTVLHFTAVDSPTVVSTAHNTTQPPHSVSFTFSQDVSASLSTASLKLTNSASQSFTAASVSWNAATLTGTWTYTGALPDGSYTAVLQAASVSNTHGDHLDGNGDGIPGDNYTTTFSIVKPTLTVSGAASVNVGAAYQLTLGPITDAGQTAPSYLVHWGDGTTSTATAAGALPHTYTQALGAITFTVDVIDANGTHANCASQALTVNTVSVGISGNTNANPGAAYTLNLNSVTDAGFIPSAYIVHWGDGSTSTYTALGPETHPYANPGNVPTPENISVDLVDNSGPGGAPNTNAGVAAMTITLNASPSVPISGSANANIGGNFTLNVGAISDPGFTVSQLSVNWGDGSVPQIFPLGTTQLTHTFAATAPASDTISITLTDNSGTYANAGVFTTTVNPSPTVALSGNTTAAAGMNYALTVSPAVDPGQTVISYLVNWGDGTSSPASPTPGIFNHIFTQAGNDLITVDLTDGTGTYRAAGEWDVTIGAGTPSINLSANNANANATGVYTLNLGKVIDFGGTPTSYTVNWGDGQSNTASAGPFAHVYANPASAQITVDLTDTTGNTYRAAGSLALTVNPPPTLTLIGSATAQAGSAYSLTLGAVSDPGYAVTNYLIHWGDGTTSSSSTAGAVLKHTYGSAGAKPITVDITDATGTYAAAGAKTVAVTGPTVPLSGNANANATGTYSLTLGTASDPGNKVKQYIVHWGDGQSTTYKTAGVKTHVYAKPGAETITVDLVDNVTTYAAVASMNIAVNSPPTLTLIGTSTVAAKSLYTLQLGPATDPGYTPTKYTIHWGDGTTTTTTLADATLVHTYAAARTATITVDLTDPTGTFTAVARETVTVTPKVKSALARLVTHVKKKIARK